MVKLIVIIPVLLNNGGRTVKATVQADIEENHSMAEVIWFINEVGLQVDTGEPVQIKEWGSETELALAVYSPSKPYTDKAGLPAPTWKNNLPVCPLHNDTMLRSKYRGGGYWCNKSDFGKKCTVRFTEGGEWRGLSALDLEQH